MPCRGLRWAGRVPRGRPSKKMAPPEVGMSPITARRVVVFPAPFLPTRATVVPPGTSTVIPRRTSIPPRATSRRSIRSMPRPPRADLGPGRVPQDRAGRPLGHHAPLGDDRHPVRVPGHDLHVVLHEHPGRLAGPQGADEGIHDAELLAGA